MASFLAVPVDPKKNLATKSAAAPRRFSSGKANSAKQQTTRKNVAKKKVGATTNLKRTSIGNKKKMNKNSEGRQQDSGGNTTNSQGKDKPNVVFNVDKRARRINNGALFSRGIEMFRSKHPFQAKVLKEEKKTHRSILIFIAFSSGQDHCFKMKLTEVSSRVLAALKMEFVFTKAL